MSRNQPTRLTRSKLRVADHREVFTSPAWLVEAMLDLVNANISADDGERAGRGPDRE
jgi:hypothetical protein